MPTHLPTLTSTNRLPQTNITGFYDPAFGADKVLDVTYTFRGGEHHTRIRDTEALCIPQRAHRLAAN